MPDSFAFRQSVGQAIIDKIVERTQDRRVDRHSNKFAKYSKGYAASLEFKAFGKSKGPANLTLTGDMLGFMDIIDTSRDTITIGFPERIDQLKAHGHILGSSPGPRVKRDFFGLPNDEYDSLKGDFTLPSDPGAVDQAATPGFTTLAGLFVTEEQEATPLTTLAELFI